MIAKYYDKLFNVDFYNNNIEIYTFKDFLNPLFQKHKTGKGRVYFSKTVEKSELQELYDINFFAEWNGKIFNCGYDGEGVIILRESKDFSYAKEHDFEQLDRFFYVKRVPIEECTKLGVLKQDLLQDEYGNVSKEKIVSVEEFEKLYYDNITDLM